MLWIKAFHVVAVVCWFAVLFYLPRLFVYHAMAEDQVSKKRFQVMERKLLSGIGNPAMAAALVLGGWTASYNWHYYASSTWFWLKMLLVAILVGYHHACAIYVRKFRADEPPRSHIYFRWFNEFPVLILVAVVILVVVKQPV